MRRKMTQMIVLAVFVVALAVPSVASAYYTKVGAFGSTYLRLEDGTYTGVNYSYGGIIYNTSSRGMRGYWKNVGIPSHWHIDYNYWVTTYNGQPCRVFDGAWYDI